MSFGDLGLAIHATDFDAASVTGFGADDSIAIKISYSAGDLSMSYVTETLDTADTTRTQLDVSYDLGGGAAVKLRSRDDDAAATTEWSHYNRLLLSVGF